MKKKQKSKKEKALRNLKILGILLIIVGAFFILGDEDHLGATDQGVTRASTAIKFGADFYTTSAQYTGLAANAITDLYDMVQNSIGIFFVFIGLADCILISYFSEDKCVALKEPTEENVAQ